MDEVPKLVLCATLGLGLGCDGGCDGVNGWEVWGGVKRGECEGV